MTQRYHYVAYCDNCHWVSPIEYWSERDAFDAVNEHVQLEHAFAWGVRMELDAE